MDGVRSGMLGLAMAATLVAGAGACSLGGEEISAGGEWEQFDVDGAFSADFPSEPDEDGVAGGGTGYVVNDGSLEVGVAFSELPGAPAEIPADLAESVLSDANEGAAGGVNGAVVANEIVAGSPYPAMDTEFTGTRGGDPIVGFGRSLISGGQLFLLLALGPHDDRAEVEAVFDRFVAGFQPAAAAT